MTNHPLEKAGRKPARLLLLALPALLLAAGCKREAIKTYRIAKEQDQMQAQAAPALSTDSPNPKLPAGHPDISPMPAAGLPVADQSASPQLSWTTPAGWTEVPPTELRVASFKISGAGGKSADVSVIPLGGMAGTDLGNVNRWRGQVGLPAVTESELQKSAQSVEANGQPAQLYDVAGENPASGDKTRIVGVIQHRPDATCFYKMTGDADLVEQQKPAFIEFLKSLKMQPAQSSNGADEIPVSMPPAQSAIPGTSLGKQNFLVPNANTTTTGGLDSGGGKPIWTIAPGWQEVSGGQFLVAKFTMTGENGAVAAINVSSSAGDGGGLAANVNRWRGQIGLPPIVEIMTTPVDVSAGKAQLVDMNGFSVQSGQPARTIGIIVPQSGRVWFYKLMGDPKLVESQKDAFVKFVQSAKY